tara:strand:+ start:130 stop:324 length:195 start_codon:yes stop_codon:yes gene_type:complete
MKTNKIKYDNYRTERAKNYGKALGFINHLILFKENYKLDSYLIERIESVLNRDKELSNMEVDYS